MFYNSIIILIPVGSCYFMIQYVEVGIQPVLGNLKRNSLRCMDSRKSLTHYADVIK